MWSFSHQTPIVPARIYLLVGVIKQRTVTVLGFPYRNFQDIPKRILCILSDFYKLSMINNTGGRKVTPAGPANTWHSCLDEDEMGD